MKRDFIKKNNFFVLLLLVLFFTGCSVTKQVVGEYYLQQNNYNDGYRHFKEEVSLNKDSDTNHYYYARFLIAKGKFKEAIVHLNKSIQLKPNKSLYHSWLGVVYGNMKQYNNERNAYLKALSLDKNNLQALTYLAHNYFDKKDYKKALEHYNKVLKLTPENQSALYNRALTLNKLKRVPEEILAWQEYLSYYPSGAMAKKAVEKLNTHKDFSFKNHLIGFKTVTLKQITFEPFSSTIDYESTFSLDALGEILKKNKKTSIYIIAYQLNNKKLAKEKAISIRDYIITKYPEIDKKRLKLGWFDTSRIVKIKKQRYKLHEDINFITYVKK